MQTVAGAVAVATPSAASLEGLIAHRAELLRAYQDDAYADRYRRFVHQVAEAEQKQAPGRKGLALAVARYYFKLLAYKDEYEVARLFSSPDFRGKLERQFEGDYRLEFSLAPPLLARRDAVTGEPRKRRFGPWMQNVFRTLARFRTLRGTPLDPFGYTRERKAERALIVQYEDVVGELLAHLDADNHALAVEIASVPEHIRGFGPVKMRHIEEAKQIEAALLTAFRRRETPPRAA